MLLIILDDLNLIFKSDSTMPSRCLESESIEANRHELAFLPLFSPSSPSHQLLISCEKENNPSSSSPLIIRHSQVNQGFLFILQFHHYQPTEEEKRDESLVETTSDGTRDCLQLCIVPDASISLSSTISSGEEGTASSFSSKDSFLESNEFLQEFWKHLLGLAIPTTVGLIVSACSLVKTTEIHIVVIVLSFATALICNGLLLRKTFTRISTFMLVSGSALQMLSSQLKTIYRRKVEGAQVK